MRIFLCLFSFMFVNAVNKGKLQPREIAYGSIVDYSLMKISYPFMVRIIIDGKRCGGAVIADRFIATARHCLELCRCFNNQATQRWSRCPECFVKLRESNDYEPDTETIHSIKQVHLPYDSGDPYMVVNKTDLAIIETEDDINSCEEENRHCWHIDPVKPHDPTKHGSIRELETVRTLGWGATEESLSGEEQSEFLAQLDVKINRTYNPNNIYLMETNVGENDADPCQGDSGGPLLRKDENGEWILIGTLLGGGYRCGEPNSRDRTSDWSKISIHIHWIKVIIKGYPSTTETTETTGFAGYPSTETTKKVISTNTLDVLTVSSDDGPGGQEQRTKMGVFRRSNQERNGHPVYVNHDGSNELFFTSTSQWLIGPSHTRDAGGVLSVKSSQGIPVHGWKYFIIAEDVWVEDKKLTVTAGQPVYPRVLMMSSKGPAADRQPNRMGKYYQVMGRKKNGRPVWKHQDNEQWFFYNDVDNWMVGPDPEGISGGIATVKPGQVRIPTNGWKYFDQTTDQGWHEDDQLSVIQYSDFL